MYFVDVFCCLWIESHIIEHSCKDLQQHHFFDWRERWRALCEGNNTL